VVVRVPGDTLHFESARRSWLLLTANRSGVERPTEQKSVAGGTPCDDPSLTTDGQVARMYQWPRSPRPRMLDDRGHYDANTEGAGGRAWMITFSRGW
jgi:hypothetical protein